MPRPRLLRDFEGRRADAESEALRAQVELARGNLAAAEAAAARAAELAPGFSASAERLRAAVHAGGARLAGGARGARPDREPRLRAHG